MIFYRFSEAGRLGLCEARLKIIAFYGGKINKQYLVWAG